MIKVRHVEFFRISINKFTFQPTLRCQSCQWQNIQSGIFNSTHAHSLLNGGTFSNDWHLMMFFLNMPCLSFNFILITRERARKIFFPAAQIGKNSSTSKLFIEKKTHHKQHFVKANNDDDDDLSVREFLQK